MGAALQEATAAGKVEESGFLARVQRIRSNPLTHLLAIGVASRVALAFVATVAANALPPFLPPGASWNDGPPVIRYFARWDSGYYMDLARYGYGFKPEAWAFDPGYPFTLATLHSAIPWLDLPTIGFLVSNASFLASIALLYKLTMRLFDEPTAWRASILLSFFPGTFYLSAVYADSLFLALLLGFFLLLLDKRWILAGLTASVAGVTRPPGIMLFAPLVLAIGLEWHRRRQISGAAFWSVPLALEGPILFLGVSWARTGDWLVSFHARATYWVHVYLHNPIPFWFNADVVNSPWWPLWMVGLVVLLCGVGWMAWDFWQKPRREVVPLYLYSAGLAGIYLFYSEAQPILRYLVVFLPAYWALAKFSKGATRSALLLGCCGILAATVGALFALWAPLY